MTEQHQKFLNRLSNSLGATFAVAKFLSMRGYDVYIPALKYSPTAKEHMDYVDTGDIKIRKGKGEWERVEVKGRGIQFSCPEDFKALGFDDMFISSKKAVDRANPLPKAYFIVSKDLKTAAIIYRKTRDQWFEKDINPTNTGNKETVYAVSVDVPKFVTL